MVDLIEFLNIPRLDQQALDYLDAITKIFVILGLPIAYFQFKITKDKEKKDREYGTYNSLDEKFIEFQKLCLSHSYLNVFDIEDKKPHILNEDQKKQELIIFTMLFSIFERAFLLYADQTTNVKKRQWTGWDTYIKSFCTRKNFLNAWRISGVTYDTDFESYIKQNIGDMV